MIEEIRNHKSWASYMIASGKGAENRLFYGRETETYDTYKNDAYFKRKK